MEPDPPRPSRSRELNWFLALVVFGTVLAVAAALWLYWLAPALFRLEA